MTEKTYTETEVKALIAAALQRAADRLFGIVVERQSQKKRAGNDYIAASAREVAKLIPTDHAAALEAVKAQERKDACAAVEEHFACVRRGHDMGKDELLAAIRAGKVQP